MSTIFTATSQRTHNFLRLNIYLSIKLGELSVIEWFVNIVQNTHDDGQNSHPKKENIKTDIEMTATAEARRNGKIALPKEEK